MKHTETVGRDSGVSDDTGVVGNIGSNAINKTVMGVMGFEMYSNLDMVGQQMRGGGGEPDGRGRRAYFKLVLTSILFIA